MAKHGNSNENDAEHHLYEIRDRRSNKVYKYGICGQPLNKDGSSPRANEQVDFLNRAMQWACFHAKVMVTNIPGRKKARQTEDSFISDYEKEHGARPPGNPGKTKG